MPLTKPHGSRETFVPPNLGAKQFEKLVLHRAESLYRDGVLELHRNGVKAAMIEGGKTVVSKSFPDFSGTVAPLGIAVSIECKVCSQASFSIGTRHNAFHQHQYRHLSRVAEMGGLAFLIVHFNLKVLKRVTHEEFTAAIRVDPTAQIWREFEAETRKTITRAEAREIGIILPWGYYSDRVKTLTPDISVLI